MAFIAAINPEAEQLQGLICTVVTLVVAVIAAQLTGR